LTVVVGLAGPSTASGAIEWPQQIDTAEATIVIYQPQLESFEGNKLSARAAVSVKGREAQEPVFGAAWVDARVSTDTDERTVHLISAEVTAVKFPEATDEQVEWFKGVVKAEIESWGLTMSLDQLIADLDLTEKEIAASENLKNDPPRVIYRTEPAVLVLIDGDPVLQDVEEGLKAVVNTSFFIVYDTQSETYYLTGGDYWYSTNNLEGEWRQIDSPPKKISDLAAEMQMMSEDDMEKVSAAMDSAGFSADVAPEIVVADEPAELIVSDGAADFAPIEGTGLLYMTNSETDIIMVIDSQKYYVLLAGRWYASEKMSGGTWAFVPPDDLPEDFASIPEDSDIGEVRASVPGTVEAKEAVLENQIPQTAAVHRDSAAVEVTYDGDPEFEKCGDSGVYYAKNTDKAVLMIDRTYYCCDDAVWFVSGSPDGPYEVADEVPDEIRTMGPECPHYNVKYVYIYDSTPEVVYVGYTPGYTCSYVYAGTVVYGTGWWYRPWWGTYYYPRPVTWGFGVHYNPYTGWGFSFGMSFGWVGWRWGWWGPHYGGWWGPGGYRWGYRHGYRHGYYHGYRHGYYAGRRAGYVHGRADAALRNHNNIYRNKPGVRPADRPVTRPSTRPSTQPSTRPSTRPSTQPSTRPSTQPSTRPSTQPSTRPSTQPSTRPSTQPSTRPSTMPASPADGSTMDRSRPAQTQNNVFADKNGNVYRKTDSGWQSRDGGNWNSPDRSSPSTRQNFNSNRSDLNRQSMARDRGNQRTQTYNNWQSTQPAGRQRPQTQQRPSGAKGGSNRTRR
jgi:hypothetical protein